jgi:hypothetical protein
MTAEYTEAVLKTDRHSLPIRDPTKPMEFIAFLSLPQSRIKPLVKLLP